MPVIRLVAPPPPLPRSTRIIYFQGQKPPLKIFGRVHYTHIFQGCDGSMAFHGKGHIQPNQMWKRGEAGWKRHPLMHHPMHLVITIKQSFQMFSTYVK